MENDELKQLICEKLQIDYDDYWDFVTGVYMNALVGPDIIQELEYYKTVKRPDMLSDEAIELLKHHAGLNIEKNEEEIPYAY